MIHSALEYKNEIELLFAKHIYDIRNQYYYGYPGTNMIRIHENTYDGHQFAITKDGTNDVIGVVQYSINLVTGSVFDFGIISFTDNDNFGKDLLEIVHNIFTKYNLNRMEFRCFSGNPVLRHYKKFMKVANGNQVGYFHECGKLMDGSIHDAYAFEILRRDYVLSQLYARMERELKRRNSKR